MVGTVSPTRSTRSGLAHLSVWLHLAPDDEIQLTNVVDVLSVWCGSPRFVPHVTLVGGFDAETVDATARAEELAATLEPMDVVLTTPRCERRRVAEWLL